MKALVWRGTEDIRCENVPDPKILNRRDAIVRITSSCICGSDLHLVDGFIPFMKPGEPMDLGLARQQWESVKSAFEDAGFSAEVLTSVEGLEDMVFANNQVFVSGAAQQKFIVPSRMRFASRQKEVPHYVACA